MAFSVISITPGLSAADHERAVGSAPPYAETTADYSVLLEEARWNLVDRIDVSATFAGTVRRLVHQLETRADEVGEVLGRAEHADYLARKQRSLPAIDQGIVRRELIVAVTGIGEAY